MKKSAFLRSIALAIGLIGMRAEARNLIVYNETSQPITVIYYSSNQGVLYKGFFYPNRNAQVTVDNNLEAGNSYIMSHNPDNGDVLYIQSNDKKNYTNGSLSGVQEGNEDIVVRVKPDYHIVFDQNAASLNPVHLKLNA